LTTTKKPARKEDINNALGEASGNRWQLAIVVLGNVPPQAYDYIKQLGNQRLGLMTQCVSLAALADNIEKLHMCK
jgi:hypothetical protein